VGIDDRSDLPRTADLAVIGSGIAGAASAFHAARSGLRPLILEGSSSTTRRSFAWSRSPWI
jgi:glycine/D-amino acid oxidase-like deaminating enzyme